MRNKYERIGLIVILGFFLTPQFLLGQVRHNYPDRESSEAILGGAGVGFILFWLGFLMGQFFDMLSRRSLARRQKTINPKGWRFHLQSIRITLHFLGAIIVGFGSASISYRREGFLSSDKITIGIGLIITAAAAFCGLFPDYEMKSKKLFNRLLGR